MKRLICAALALSLLGATAASAQPYHHGYGWRLLAAAGMAAAMAAP